MITEDQFNSIQVGCKIQLADDIFPMSLRGAIVVVVGKGGKNVRVQDPRCEATHDSLARDDQALCVYPHHIMNVFTGYDDDFDCDINESILL